MSNPITGYDFRYNADDYTPEDIKGFLNGIAKSYTFQKEKGDTGYIHYQGRLRLIKKRRRPQALKLFVSPPNYFQPTVNSEYYNGDAFYVQKEDTRIEGPWTDKDEVKVLTQQLIWYKNQEERPFQKVLREKASQFCMRTIDLIWDTTGNCGKSLFCESLEYDGIAEEVPPYRMMDDIFQWVCSRPEKKCYVVDLPRGMKKSHLGDFYSGIEVIKNGVAFDKRYSGTKKRFSRPRIFVFTNTLPVLNLMTKDRWNIWKVNEKYELIPYKINGVVSTCLSFFCVALSLY